MISDAISETHDATTLVLFTGNDRLDYKPGHYITIDPHQFRALNRFTAFLEDQKERKEPPRAYSLFSAPSEEHLSITIKEEYYVSGSTKYPPLLSPLLVHRLPKGTKMTVTGFVGPYTMPDDIESKTDHLVHLCAGSGVVPNLSMIKEALARDLKIRHTLIYSNKTFEDIIYRGFLEDLKLRYKDRVRVIHTLTREKEDKHPNFDYIPGRISEALVKESVSDLSAAEFFLCGPANTKWDRLTARAKGHEPSPKFLESSLEILKNLGVDKSQIHKESYG